MHSNVSKICTVLILPCHLPVKLAVEHSFVCCVETLEVIQNRQCYMRRFLRGFWKLQSKLVILFEIISLTVLAQFAIEFYA